MKNEYNIKINKAKTEVVVCLIKNKGNPTNTIWRPVSSDWTGTKPEQYDNREQKYCQRENKPR